MVKKSMFDAQVYDLNEATIRTIGANIKAIRESMGLMQKQVAEQIGVKQSLIAHMENASRDSRSGELRPISIKALCSLSIAFGVPLQAFLIPRSVKVSHGRRTA